MRALGGPVKPTYNWRSTQPRTLIRLASSRDCCCSSAQIHSPLHTSAIHVRGPAAKSTSWSSQPHRWTVPRRTLQSCRAETGSDASGSDRHLHASSASSASAEQGASAKGEEGRSQGPTDAEVDAYWHHNLSNIGVDARAENMDDWSPLQQLARLAGQVATDCKATFLWLARIVTGLWAAAANAVMGVAMYFPSVAQRVKLRRLKRELEQSINPASPTHANQAACVAAYAQALNSSKQPGEVIRLWEMGELSVNDDVAVEYLKALVQSGRISSFSASDVIREGEQHRSMSEFLRQFRSRLEDNGRAIPLGETSLRPLHVSLQGMSMRTAQPSGGFLSFLLSILRSVLSIALAMFLVSSLTLFGYATMRRYAPSAGVSMTASSAAVAAPPNTSFAPKEYSKENLPEKSIKTFDDVRGCDEAKEEVAEIVEFLKDPERFTRLGGKLPKGVLLTGPPGTGKTLLARAIAGEAGVPFFFRAGSEFEEMFVGVGSRRVRNLFAAAKQAAPCIVFIDEIDAIGQARGSSYESSSSKTLNQLLVEMDGFEVNEGIIVIAATNLEKKLDPALTRPGRFDRQVAVPLPDVRGRLDIINYYLKGKPLAEDVDPQLLARRTPGFSGAELNNLINEAALSAAKNNLDTIGATALDEARDKILMGNPRASMVQTAEARRLTAYHEAGHALVALNTPGATPIHKATIVPRGHALGMVSMLPHQDEYSITLQQMRAGIDVSMGGRVAEELIFGADQVTSGATSDLRAATQQARHMVMDCGMSDQIGPVFVSNDNSGETRKTVDAEVNRMLREAYTRVTDMLAAREADLHRLAKALLDHETLTAAEIKEVLAGTFTRAPVARKLAVSDLEALPAEDGGLPVPAPAASEAYDVADDV